MQPGFIWLRANLGGERVVPGGIKMHPLHLPCLNSSSPGFLLLRQLSQDDFGLRAKMALPEG